MTHQLQNAPVESHADRPQVRSMLPFRTHQEKCRTYLQYQIRFQDGQYGPASIEVGDPNLAIDQQYNALGINILKLMQMYWEQESKVDGLMKERDELLTKNKILEADKYSLNKEKGEYERRYHELKNKNGSKKGEIK